MKLDRVIAVRNDKTVYKDGDRCVKVFNAEYDKADVGELPPLSSGDDNGNEKPKPNPNDPSNPNPDTNVDYSDIQFTLDMNVGQGIVGEKVSSDVLLGAIEKALASTNFTMQGKSYIQGSVCKIQGGDCSRGRKGKRGGRSLYSRYGKTREPSYRQPAPRTLGKTGRPR